MNGPGYHKPVFSSDALAHQHSLGQSSTAVIKGGVRNLHSCQLRDVRLKLEDCLQRALGDFRLIRSVGGIKLGSRYQCVDDDRNVMAINASTNKQCWLDFIFG